MRQIRRFFIELNRPKACKSQMITTITTTTFRIVFIFLSIGIKVFTSQSATPTIISTNKTVSNDIINFLNDYPKMSRFVYCTVTQP